jgi:hypothetical protein
MESSGWIMLTLYHESGQVCRRFSGRVFFCPILEITTDQFRQEAELCFSLPADSPPELAPGVCRSQTMKACDQQALKPIGGDDQLPHALKDSSLDESH